MRNAECFVQVYMRDVSSNISWLCYSNLRIEIGAIHIHLATMIMNNLANLLHGFFIHSVCGRVGNHQRGEIISICLSFAAQIFNIYVAIVVAANEDNLHANHLRACRIRTVCRSRY